LLNPTKRGSFMFKFSIKSPLVVATGLLLLAAGIKYTMAITAFTPSLQPVGYVAQDEVTNFDLRSDKEKLYRTEYQREFWSGNLYSYPVDKFGIVNIGAEDWTDGAAEQIGLQNYDTGRYIITMKEDGSKVPFRWASLSPTQQAALTTSTVVNFLRGDRSNERTATPPGTFRQRASALGDIVHSRPYYVADATNPTIFVGANDGMLHAINKADGKERWAYIPSMLIPKLKSLSTDPYVHDYFVDGQITIGNVTTASGSKRILVGNLGGGGKGVYALDITGSAGLDATGESGAVNKIMWEITPGKINASSVINTSEYSNLGYTYGTPILDNVEGSDALIFGNGYNDGGDYNAYLYVVNPLTGRLIKAIKAGNSGTASNPNGLFNAQIIDTNGDGQADIAYAGDLNGTMWKFDLKSTGATNATALFTTSPAQPITGTPGVGGHPKGGYMVNFGTGSMLTPTDGSSTAVYSVYGIWDGAPSTNTALITQTLADHTATFSVAADPIRVRSVSDNTVSWATAKGWIVPLPAGERLVGEGSFTENGRYYFNAHNPTITSAVGNTGATIRGTNWLMELDYLTGSAKNSPFLDVSNDIKLNNDDRLKESSGSPTLTVSGIPVGKFISTGVMSQPILVQLASLNETLFNQNPDITVPATIPTTISTTSPTSTTTTTVSDPGVAGGHFDQDVYYKAGGDTCTSGCQSTNHVHQYDDKYDVTGVNMLNASNTVDNLSNAIPSTSTGFKVLAQNQYLSPAVKLHIGNASYLYNVDAGYIRLKNYVTSANLDLATLPTYTRTSIGSLAINMPVDTLTSRDWWQGTVPDVRSGLHPTVTGCVKKAAGASDGNMYQPIIPPANGTDGPGVKGWGSTTPATATGVRHNGALIIQIIKDTTPNSAIEQSVPNRPEYGWRVKSANYSTYVLAEYTTFWHHPNSKCYGDVGWTKAPGTDTSSSTFLGRAPGSTDPHIGNLGAAGTVVTTTTGGTATLAVASVSTTTTGNVTTTIITYNDGSRATIVTTTNTDATKTVVTTDRTGASTTQTIANTRGTAIGGGDERGLQARTGRLSWQELIRP
jgi:hypothetical protein